jgi:hypothetical protein
MNRGLPGSTLAKSTGMPGPMVELMLHACAVQPRIKQTKQKRYRSARAQTKSAAEQRTRTLKYLPFTPSGLLSLNVTMNDRTFSSSFWSLKLSLPMPACTMPPLSTLN